MAEELSPTLEDYLESIWRIETRKRVARPRDICEAQDVAKSTVTAALKSLSEKELINYAPYEFATLTDEGREKAEKIVARHRIMLDFLQTILGLDPEIADKTACRMEHAVDRQALERFVCFMAFMKKCEKAESKCQEEFQRFLAERDQQEECHQCVERYVEEIESDLREAEA